MYFFIYLIIFKSFIIYLPIHDFLYLFILNHSLVSFSILVDGGWSDYGDWSKFSDCSVTCGGGIQWREHTRQCNNPSPQYGGADCKGKDTERESRACNEHHCPSKYIVAFYTVQPTFYGLKQQI